MLHTPERLPDETQADYRKRRAQSNAWQPLANPWPKSVLTGHLGQHTNPQRNKARRALRLSKFARAQQWARPEPKEAKPRKHKQHAHPLRDDHGAITLRGKQHPYQAPQLIYRGRKVWLAGISAQRGY